MKKQLLALCCALAVAGAATAKIVGATSPGGNLRLEIEVADKISYTVWSGADKVLDACTLSLTLDDRTLGEAPRLRSVKRSSADEMLERRNPTKDAVVRNCYNAVQLRFAGDYAVEFRLFDDGVAYRFVTSLPGEVEVLGEECRLGLPAGSEAWLSEVNGFRSMYEEPYTRVAMAEYTPADKMSYLPVLVGMPGGKKLLLAESDVRDYPCMFVRSDGRGGFESLFPRVPKEYGPDGDRSLKVLSEEPYIARTQGTRTFPWRLAVVAGEDADLIENELVWLLAAPAADTDWEWVKPGLVSWDWWNGMRLSGVDFRAGRNTESYRYYIDFAAKYGVPYIIMDEGWSASTTDVFRPNPDLDLPGLIAYGTERAVADMARRREGHGTPFHDARRVGHPGREDRLHGSQRPVDGQLLRARDQVCGRPPYLRRLARLLYTQGSFPHLPEPADLRGGARHGAGRPLQTRQQQLPAFHPQCRRPHGLHPGRDVLLSARG